MAAKTKVCHAAFNIMNLRSRNILFPFRKQENLLFHLFEFKKSQTTGKVSLHQRLPTKFYSFQQQGKPVVVGSGGGR